MSYHRIPLKENDKEEYLFSLSKISQKINYIIMIGDKEEANKTLAIRKDGKVKFGVKRDVFLKEILEEIKSRK